MDMLSLKLLSSSCLFCVNSSICVRKFKITEDYGGGNTIRYDLTSFLGHQIEPYLKDDDLLCSNCMNFFENMAYTKRRLIDFLRNRDESEAIKMQGFNDIWKGFTKFAFNLVKFNANDSDETWDASDLHNRSLTPNPLVHAYSEPYNSAYESKLSEIERVRSKSTAPSEGVSETDFEVRQLLGKRTRRKKRRRNWTTRRGEQKSRALSRKYPGVQDTIERNCYTSMSGKSVSLSEESVHRSKSTIPRRKRTVKTRSTSRLENCLATAAAEKALKHFDCDEINCSLRFEKFENLVQHKIFDHHIIARFPCKQCNFKATTKVELDKHTTKTHDVEMIMCFQCKAEFQGTQNLQKHLKKHQEYSIGCKFCYLNFLCRADLVEHVAKEHQGPKKKKIHEKPSYILQAVVNEEKMRKTPTNNWEKKNCFFRKEFKSVVLRAEKSPSPELDVKSLLRPVNVSVPIMITNVSPTDAVSDHFVSVSNEKASVISAKELENVQVSSELITDIPESENEYHIAPIIPENDLTMLENNLQLTRLKPIVVLKRLDLKKLPPKL